MPRLSTVFQSCTSDELRKIVEAGGPFINSAQAYLDRRTKGQDHEPTPAERDGETRAVLEQLMRPIKK